MINLIGNAAKFTENGKVSLKIYKKDKNAVFEVADTGIGMAEEHLNMIFEEFIQLKGSKTHTSPMNSTGLGLSLCKRFVNLLGGEILVESKLNNGSKFSVIIPISRAGY